MRVPVESHGDGTQRPSLRRRLVGAFERSVLGPLLPRPGLDPGIRAQKVATLYSRLMAAMMLNLVMAVIYVLFMPRGASPMKTGLWLIGMALVVLARYLDIRDYQRREGQGGEWVLRIQAGACLQAAMWAYAALALLPGDAAGRLIGVLLLVGISGAVVIFQSPIWSAYCMYIAVMMVPACVGLLVAPEEGMRTLGVLGLVYAMVMAFASGGACRRLEDLLVSARANAELYNQRRLEEGLLQAQKLESLGVLAGGVAHDFNNLLGAILGNLNLLQLKADPESAVLLGTMETAVGRAAALAKQMLAYSGGGRFVVEDLDLDPFLRAADPLLRACVARQAHLVLELGVEGRAIAADAGQLQQLLVTLVANASEALQGREGEIRVRTRKVMLDASRAAKAGAILPLLPGEHVLLEVEDTGEGMAPDVVARIFDPFFTTRGAGRGLGLSAALGILRSHSAGITIRSRPGSGTTIKVYFPVSTRASVRDTADAVSPRPFNGRVLLVDDEPTLRETVETMLERLGLEVETARDGVEALERFQAGAGEIGLVILDLSMPRMDGHQAFQALRRLAPDLPVILSSGFNAQTSTELLQGPGPSSFLQKPYTIRELKAAMETTLGVGL